jgi:hypothetical protein
MSYSENFWTEPTLSIARQGEIEASTPLSFNPERSRRVEAGNS